MHAINNASNPSKLFLLVPYDYPIQSHLVNPFSPLINVIVRAGMMIAYLLKLVIFMSNKLNKIKSTVDNQVDK